MILCVKKKTHVPKSLPSHENYENYELGAQQQNRNVRLQLLTYNNINLTLLLHHNFKRHIRWCSVHFALKASFSWSKPVDYSESKSWAEALKRRK